MKRASVSILAVVGASSLVLAASQSVYAEGEGLRLCLAFRGEYRDGMPLLIQWGRGEVRSYAFHDGPGQQYVHDRVILERGNVIVPTNGNECPELTLVKNENGMDVNVMNIQPPQRLQGEESRPTEAAAEVEPFLEADAAEEADAAAEDVLLLTVQEKATGIRMQTLKQMARCRLSFTREALMAPLTDVQRRELPPSGVFLVVVTLENHAGEDRPTCSGTTYPENNHLVGVEDLEFAWCPTGVNAGDSLPADCTLVRGTLP